MKMSDVFEGDVIQDADTLLASGYGELANFSGYKKEARYAAHAINNHDRLDQENAELREFAKRMISHITGHDSDQAKHYWNQELDKLLNKQG